MLGRGPHDWASALRRAVDLEHWAAFNASFARLCDWLREIATGSEETRAPATILVLGGDVHNAYVAEVDLGTASRAQPRLPDRLLSLPKQPASE